MEKRPFIGVATTTQIAFVHDGELCLERMNVLADDGAGVLCERLPPVGAELQVAFRLSTAARAIRAKARVVSHVPTTPTGVALREQIGERAFVSSMGAAIGDSATAVFRMADLEGARKSEPKAAPASASASASSASGFALVFVDLDAAQQETVRRHVAYSRRLTDKLAARGDALVSTAEDDTLAAMFDEGDLSKKAMDW